MGKDITKATEGGVPVAYDYGDDAGAGFEGTKGSDLSVPFISVLQSNSPQVEDKLIEGAESGMLFNTVTQAIVPGDKGLVFLPCHKETAYVEWVPRTKGGGFVGLHDPAGDVVKDAILRNDGSAFGKLTVGDNELVETYYVYGLCLNNEGTEVEGFAVLSFSSTKIKPYRDWTTAMYLLKGKPPLFANRARLQTVKQKNENGTFYNFKIVPLRENWAASLIDPKTESALLLEAKEFRDMVISGMARADFAQERATGTPPSGSGAKEGGAPPF